MSRIRTRQRLVAGDVEHLRERPRRPGDGLLGLANLKLGLLDLGLEGEDRILGDLLALQEILVDLQELGDPLEVGLAEGQGELGRRDVDEGRVEVVDLLPDGILELGLDGPPGGPRDLGSRLPLVADVERMRDVDVVLGLAAGTGPAVSAVGHELRVGVEDRVGAQARGQDVGLGHRDLVPHGDDVEVLADHEVDGVVQVHPVLRRRRRRAPSGRSSSP